MERAGIDRPTARSHSVVDMLDFGKHVAAVETAVLIFETGHKSNLCLFARKTREKRFNMSESLEQQAKKWIQWDPNKTTAAAVEKTLSDEDELRVLFSKRIGFGTAGLRAEMKPGPSGMNDLVVLQTAQGIIRYCEKSVSQSSYKVVIGYDHRAKTELNLSSHSFAILSALVFKQAGWECLLLDGYVHTPTVPFTMMQTGAVAGIMVTASHNPKQDAGYKVYWKDACQIRSPVDQGIADAILDNLEPWHDYGALLDALKSENSSDTCFGLSASPKPYTDAYVQALQKSGLVKPVTTEKQPKFAYTAMHGVGHSVAIEAWKLLGVAPFYSVPEQEAPDASFPTVSFPNPEEKGALDIGQAFAVSQGCSILFANDPDADRLAVTEHCPESGKWTVFSGDQIGCLLGLYLYENMAYEKPSMCASTVSSKLLAEIARVEGFHFEDTLTGFKYIGSRACELSKEDFKPLFAYEEAIGFCCGDIVFDKDGISAMLVFAQLTCSVYAQGKTIGQHLQGIYDKYGEFVSRNGYFKTPNTGVSAKIFDHMCKLLQLYKPKDGSRSVGPYLVKSIRFLGEPAFDSSTADGKPTLPTSKSSPLMTVYFQNGCVAQFRASGTEPKFKFYIEMKGQPGQSRDQVEMKLKETSDCILDILVAPEQFGLTSQ